jgi:putative transposase
MAWQHHHSGLGLLTPADVHHGLAVGLAAQRVAMRATVLATAYAAHPERFPGGLPQPPAYPTEVWINPPKTLLPAPESSNTKPLDQATRPLPTRTPWRSLAPIIAR